jgi:8-oxo-dGTP pyrophosphatase MutT (NUDIX family)
MAFAQDFPVSIKGILFFQDHVPLLLNERNEWELPGGRLEVQDETPEKCVCRELKEELSCEARVEKLIDCWLYNVLPGRHVLIVTYLCSTQQTLESLAMSNEHRQLGVFEISRIPSLNMPAGYVRSIQLAWNYKMGSRPR